MKMIDVIAKRWAKNKKQTNPKTDFVHDGTPN